METARPAGTPRAARRNPQPLVQALSSVAASEESLPEPEVERTGLAEVGDEPTRFPQAIAVDTHCHLFLMEEEPAAVVEQARAAGIGFLICVGIDPESSRRSLELAESFRGVFSTAGVHPHTASDLDREAGAVIEELLAQPTVVGVGETGLDYYRLLSPGEDQRRAFRSHIALSRETGKPLVVHVRDAWDDALSILQEEQAERVVLHCFSGDAAVAEEAVRRGYFVSFAGNVTYPNAEGLRETASSVEPERLLVETDSPFLSPQSVRGRPNSPAHLMATLGVLAEVRGLDLHQMVATTAAAARSAFPLIR
jgi:TatD DNase family protein